MLNYLNGVENSQINGKLLNKFTTLKNNALQKLPPKVLKAVNTAGKVANVGVKIGVAPMRLAFLGLVRLNALHVAQNLEKAIRKDRNKVMNWWKDFGGDFNELVKITNIGAKVKAPVINKVINVPAERKPSGSLGVVVTATAVAVATPVTASLLTLLKNIGVEAVKGSADALATAGKTALTKALNTGEKLPDVETAVVIEQPKPESKTSNPPPDPPKADKTAEDVDPVAPILDTKKSNMPLIIGGIAGLGLLAYFLTKKK